MNKPATGQTQKKVANLMQVTRNLIRTR